jgi:hypothetical protein
MPRQWTQEDTDKMDSAAQQAEMDFEQKVQEMTREQLIGAQTVIDWLEQWYRTAGYTRLCRFVKSRKVV